MTTNASTLAGGLPGVGGGRITPVAALRHWLLVGRRDLLQVRSNPKLLVFVLIQPILFVLLFVYVFGTAMTGIASTRTWPKASSTGSGPCPSPARRCWPAASWPTPSAWWPAWR